LINNKIDDPNKKMAVSKVERSDDEIAFQIMNSIEFAEERDTVNLSGLFDSLFATFLGEEQAKHIEITIEPNYNGLKLGEEFEESDLKEMLHDFDNNRRIHAKYVMKILEKALKLLKPLQNIQTLTMHDKKEKNKKSSKSNEEEEVVEECVVVGDLHGRFDDLKSIIKRFDIPGKKVAFVFNGDWVDRGYKQIEVMLTILYSFILHPKKVFLNRGNF
jgi:hypothetical protein